MRYWTVAAVGLACTASMGQMWANVRVHALGIQMSHPAPAYALADLADCKAISTFNQFSAAQLALRLQTYVSNENALDANVSKLELAIAKIDQACSQSQGNLSSLIGELDVLRNARRENRISICVEGVEFYLKREVQTDDRSSRLSGQKQDAMCAAMNKIATAILRGQLGPEQKIPDGVSSQINQVAAPFISYINDPDQSGGLNLTSACLPEPRGDRGGSFTPEGLLKFGKEIYDIAKGGAITGAYYGLGIHDWDLNPSEEDELRGVNEGRSGGSNSTKSGNKMDGSDFGSSKEHGSAGFHNIS